MRHDNPCMKCPERGCGRQAECEQYLAFYQRNRERNAENLEQAKLYDYVTRAVSETRNSRHSSTGRYRPKGRW